MGKNRRQPNFSRARITVTYLFLFHKYNSLLFTVIAACKEGYYGRFCTRPCPFGTFGADCAGRCFPQCPDENCNHVSGCINDNGITTKEFETGKKLNGQNRIFTH